jgi:hypothetical protein
MSAAKQRLVVRLSDLQAEPVRWLWPSRLAAGKLTVIDGDPSQGKSLMSLDLASRFTTAAALPDGFRPSEPLSVVLLGSEDGVRDTVLPRLQAAGANLRRVHVFRGHLKDGELERLPTFPDDCDSLRDTLRETGARLVIADPLMSFLNASYCSINDQMVRQALTPLASVAEETGAAVVLIRHLNKGGAGQKAIYRGSGSIAIIGAARTAFLVGRDPEDPDLRVLACTKNNLAAYPPALAYRIAENSAGQPVLDWAGEIDLSADELVSAPGRRPGEALEQAVEFLQGLLGKGACTRDVVVRKARGLGLSDRTLERAKSQVGVISRELHREGRNVWYWYLPSAPPITEPRFEELPPLPPLDAPPPSLKEATRRRAAAAPAPARKATRSLLDTGTPAVGPGSDRL